MTALVVVLIFYLLVAFRLTVDIWSPFLFLITAVVTLVLLLGFFLPQNKRDASVNGILVSLCVGIVMRIVLFFAEVIGGFFLFSLFKTLYFSYLYGEPNVASYFIVFVLVPFCLATAESAALTLSLYCVNKQAKFVRNRYCSFLYGMAFGLGSSIPVVLAIAPYTTGDHYARLELLNMFYALPVFFAFIGACLSAYLAVEKFPGDRTPEQLKTYSAGRGFATVALILWVVSGTTSFCFYIVPGSFMVLTVVCIIVSGVLFGGLIWRRCCLQQELAKIPLEPVPTEVVVSAV